MYRYFIKCVSGSFLRTLGRILAYITIGVLIYLFSSKLLIAHAVSLSEPKFAGYYLNDEFSIAPGGYKEADFIFNVGRFAKDPNPSESNSDYDLFFSPDSYGYVDICTSDDKPPVVWLMSNKKGYATVSSRWYKIDKPCWIGETGYGNVYRQIMTFQSIEIDTYGYSGVSGTVRLFTTSDTTTYFRVFSIGSSQEAPLTDIMYDNDLTQTDVLRDILNSLQSGNGSLNSAIENQTKKIEEQIKEQQKTNETITDSDTSGANNDANSFFNDFEDNDYGFSDIVKMPLQMINNLTAAKCTPLSFPLPFVNTNVALPCMYDIYQKYFGSILNIYQTITFGMVAYWVCINLFRMVKNFKNPDNDEIEVLDL